MPYGCIFKLYNLSVGTDILFVIIVMCAITLYLQDTSFWFVQLFLDDFIILCNIEDTTLDTTLWHNVFWIGFVSWLA